MEIILNSIETDDTFKRLIPHILLHSSFISNIGLFHGKMGIALFFAHYSRFSGNSIYDDFAGSLLDEIYEEIHNDFPVNLENGLCGVGWGIEYLVQNGFMEGDTDEILAEIDLRIMERDPRRITDMTFRKGLGGIVYYVIARMSKRNVNEKRSPFDRSYLHDLMESLNDNIYKDDENPRDLIKQFQKSLLGDEITSHQLKLPMFLFNNLPQQPEDITLLPLGLLEGLSGIGFKKMNI